MSKKTLISAIVMSCQDLCLCDSSTLFKSVLILMLFDIIWRRLKKMNNWKIESEICFLIWSISRSFTLNLRNETRMRQYLDEHDDNSSMIFWESRFFSLIIRAEMTSDWLDISISTSRIVMTWWLDFLMIQGCLEICLFRSQTSIFWCSSLSPTILHFFYFGWLSSRHTKG